MTTTRRRAILGGAALAGAMALPLSAAGRSNEAQLLFDVLSGTGSEAKAALEVITGGNRHDMWRG